MKKRQFTLAVLACVWAMTSGGAMLAQQGNPAPAPQFFLGRLSDSMCGGSHQAKVGDQQVRILFHENAVCSQIVMKHCV